MLNPSWHINAFSSLSKFTVSRSSAVATQKKQNIARKRRHNTNPPPAIERVELKRTWDQWPNQRGPNGPMEKQKVVPTHEQDPLGLRKWTRTVEYLSHSRREAQTTTNRQAEF
jgi:hypothetical protein